MAIENRRAALEIDDVGLQANAWGYLTDALGFGRATPGGDPDGGGRARALSPPHSFRGMGHRHQSPYLVLVLARLRVSTGRVGCPRGSKSSAAAAASPRRTARRRWPPMPCPGLPKPTTYAHDADRALASARQVEEISRRLGEPPVLVAATQLAFGYAHLAAGRAADAIEPARASLDLHGRVEQGECGHVRGAPGRGPAAGRRSVGRASPRRSEAIALCRRSLRGNFEAAAHGVLARALLRRDGAGGSRRRRSRARRAPPR